MLTAHNCSDTGFFRHLSNPAFWSQQFRKQITSEDHLLLQTIQNFMQILEMQEKTRKKFCDFCIIAFELVALNTRFF